MAGEQQGDHLVADLLLGQVVAVLVGSVEQQAEDVLAPLARRPAPADLLEQHPVELGPRRLHLRIRRARTA